MSTDPKGWCLSWALAPGKTHMRACVYTHPTHMHRLWLLSGPDLSGTWRPFSPCWPDFPWGWGLGEPEPRGQGLRIRGLFPVVGAALAWVSCFHGTTLSLGCPYIFFLLGLSDSVSLEHGGHVPNFVFLQPYLLGGGEGKGVSLGSCLESYLVSAALAFSGPGLKELCLFQSLGLTRNEPFNQKM